MFLISASIFFSLPPLGEFTFFPLYAAPNELLADPIFGLSVPEAVLCACCVGSEAAAQGFVLKPLDEEAEDLDDEMFLSLFGGVTGNPQGFKFCALLGIEADVGGLATGVVVFVFVDESPRGFVVEGCVPVDEGDIVRVVDRLGVGSGVTFEARGCSIDGGTREGSDATVGDDDDDDDDVFGVSDRENSGASDVTSAFFIVAGVDGGVG